MPVIFPVLTGTYGRAENTSSLPDMSYIHCQNKKQNSGQCLPLRREAVLNISTVPLANSSKFDLINWYGIVKSMSIMTSIILPEACFRRMVGHSPSGMTPSRMKSSNDDR